MILLKSTDTLELVTSSTAGIDYYVSYVDITTTAFTPNLSAGSISTATTTVLASAPAASTQRQIKYLTLRNTSSTASNTISLKHDLSGTERKITPEITLAPGEVLQFTMDNGFQILDKNGRLKVNAPDIQTFAGFSFPFLKVGTTLEAAGIRYGFAKDSGMPGAYTLGSPGINGWWVDASQTDNAANPAGASQVGTYRLPNPSIGNYYMTDCVLTTSVANYMEIADVIWYNTGLVVATLAEQGITMPAANKPARDLYGSTNGEGWSAGVLVTTTTTNVGAITNMTIRYTNSDGTQNRVGTIASFPATALIGTFMELQLQAGDRGIRSIEGITLGTSLVLGSISLVLIRRLAAIPNPATNTGSYFQKASPSTAGVRLYNGTALWLFAMANATTAQVVTGSVYIEER